MTQMIHIADTDRLAGMRSLLAAVMDKAGVAAILVPTRLTVKNRIMPTLISDPDRLADADPFAPAFPINASQQLAKLTRLPSGGQVAAVLRPCEIRSFNELVKLNQGRREDAIIIGMDCPGALSNTQFRTYVDGCATLDEATRTFLATAFADQDPPTIASACKACVHPTPEGADIAIDLFGSAADEGLTVRAQTESGDTLLATLDLPPSDATAARREPAVAAVLERHRRYRQHLLADVAAATGTLAGLATFLADCVNCHNCRVACPVCYCTTCVFTTDTFRHEPFQYLQWARRKGEVKMPTDTLFFHLTRMAHMSCACVGCGQCTNACPNDIPLADLFTAVADGVQAAFEYTAGMDLDQRPPMSGFEAEEYEAIVGL